MKQKAEAVIAGGDADVVAFGKLFIADPDLYTRALQAPIGSSCVASKLHAPSRMR